MKVFKFGGASVKDAEGIKNVIKVLKEVGYNETLIVVSAFGKTTNALEQIVREYMEDSSNMQNSILKLLKFHLDIINKLYDSDYTFIALEIQKIFEELKHFFQTNKSPDYNFIYDQVVSLGEIISTTILSNYLNYSGINNIWLDARKLIKTDNYYRDANLNWELSKEKILINIDIKNVYITQGFIGSDNNNFSTTLGREGSDYSAAIFAYVLNAEFVTIWKDVDGVLNADPRYFKKTILLNRISYQEAIELAFYGASVIHPKTLQPLQRKEIPLNVRSFLNPSKKGTIVSKGAKMEPIVPCFIIKKNQVLLRLSSLDFSFIVEENISDIFLLLHKFKMRVELIQNSAISFSVCVSNKYDNLDELEYNLRSKYNVNVYDGVTLRTIRHFNSTSLKSINKNNSNILLEQRDQNTIQLVLDE